MAEYIANFLSKGYIKTNAQNPDGGCSSIAADGLFCRNFDWDAPSHYVVIKTYPNDGYASISTTGFAFLGMGEEQTRWSVVYDKTNLMATICFDCDWDNPLIFNIAE